MSAVPSGIDKLVIKLDLSVREGDIGIAGVDESLSTLTTVERFISPGRSIVTLAIPEIEKTKAIFLRTVSTQTSRPEVSLLGISAHKTAGLRLVRRQHDLRFDLIVICSPPKTATQTVEQTILALNSSVQVRRHHFLSDVALARASDRAESAPAGISTAFRLQIEEAKRIRKEIELTRNLKGSIGIITGVREPIDQAIGSIFELLPYTLPYYAELHAAGPGLVGLLKDVVIQAWQAAAKVNFSAEFRHPFWGTLGVMQVFFKDEFLSVTGLELPRHPIDPAVGFSILSNEAASVLIYRYEDIDRGLAKALSAFLDHPNVQLKNENLAKYKPYAKLYGEFRRTFKIPLELCRTIYDRISYVRDFYTDAEIARFISRWSAG